MFGVLSKYRDVVTVVACLLLPLMVLYTQSRSDADAGPVVRAILQITSPLQSGMSSLVEAGSEAWTRHWQDAESLDDARRQRMEMARLRLQASRVEELERENQMLRALMLAAPTPGSARVLAARVIARGASAAYRTLRVDMGRQAGLERGMAVLAPEGAVGSILRTAQGYSDVLLITDRQSAVDVFLPRSHASGLARGPGAEENATLKVDGLDRTADIQEGDEVLASGLGARFPRGTKVGTVVSVETPEGSFNQTAQVQPAVSFWRLSHVLVVLDPEEKPTLAVPLGPQMKSEGPEPPATPLGPAAPPAEVLSPPEADDDGDAGPTPLDAGPAAGAVP